MYFEYQRYMPLAEEILSNMASVSGIGSLAGLAAYVFSALAIYTIAQRRGIKHAWMAWIPVLDVWILGSISDQYRYVVKGQVKNKRKVLLTVAILKGILAIASIVRVAVTAVLTISGLAQGIGEQAMLQTLMEGLLNGMIFYIPTLILGIVGLVIEIMALYDLYTSCDPANNVLYLVLSLIPGINKITEPLFLFLCRNQDAGMPPRRETVVENPAEF